ncbi:MULTISPECIES: AMP-dependent synthetase/ligase [unclassified Streptomyces]|uniref:AMP-dependent synthetase/ligase n=1 Tax=unclassified Streptomyces TaxID=2593676 RepID=UPI00224F302A|nr:MULTISPECIES: AMP-dependent synthetase/ligase [unclassified Streptomyces]WSP58844.1 AMP-dependent synthetase/ligase [Streptomyces sp. NBC_01241]WSU20642.1 AMP-dependent synthetase/ligase [Streptomyces sp. NBC_01108]MCX4790569.1 AMP-dependent synthetase/ligase [Streptomyces sp. NBC_01221]MCX4793705.1 AMP-dependent synthetase/ligase [Streptomyces sp. NBC_01242]WSJ35126.1 AMP-dependent synthetase/ligase [Streptomyces sp. NBC_01321]
MAAAPLVGGLADVVFDYAEQDPDRVALGRKDTSGRWRDVTAATFRDEVLALAKGLIAHGVRFGDRVALMSRTRYEWTLFDFALWTVGARSVPVYPTSSAEQVLWMLHDADVSAVMVEHEDHAMTIASVIDQLPGLKRLWQLDADAVNELLDAGAQIEDEVVHRHRRAVTPESVATIIYTSGTTGRPKGCVITHANFMFETDTMASRWESVFHSKPGDEAATLLFLPLAHVFGRMVEVAAVRGRVKLGHQPELSAKALMPDLVSFRPTFILAVPYIFEKVFHGARRKAEAEGRAGAFDKAVDIAVKYAEAVEARAFGTGPGPSAGLRMQHQFFDKIVYRKVREAMGGRIRHAMSGGSGMERQLGLFFAGAGVTVYEGYGLTESTAAATANPPERTRYGTVGQPIPGTTVHIAEDGEVWVHGDNVFAGYLGAPEATAAVLREGWLATGDLGALDEDGYLTITGRKKEILVTSGGKSVSPTGLEERVRAHPLVAQCIVVGNDRPYVAALVTVDHESVDHWLAIQGRAPLRPAELVRDPDLEMEVRRAVVAANTAVSQAESIRTFRILAHPFSEEHGLLTPSLKLKRKAIETAYAAEVDALYR